MEIETLLSNLCGTILLYFVPYVVVRLIHRRSFSLKAAKIMTIVWAIVSAAIVVAIKFATGATSPTGTRGLNVAAIFIWHGFGYYVLLTESKREKANHNSAPTAEPQTLINGKPWRDHETKAETHDRAPKSSVAADPYNVDDVEVNIVNVPGAKQRQQLDRQMKAVISLAVVAFIIAAIAAGFAIYKNAECRQLRSERNAVQRSLNAVNTQYDDLKEKYDSEIKDREFMFSSNNQNVLELAFYKRYIVCTNDEKYYHQYSCKNFTETKSFRVFTKDDAKRLGYKPCPKCFKN